MSSITAILTAFRRPQNIVPLTEAIRCQTIRPTAIWAWANDPSEKMKGILAEAKLDRVVTSSENALFHGRFALALLARTEFVAVFDDDSIPGENWFGNCLETMARTPGILGTAGVVLHEVGYARRTMHGWQRPCDEAVEVDLVGQTWFLRTEWVKHLFSGPAVTGTNGEDIELAARAWRLGGTRSFCPPHPADDHSRWGSTRGLELGVDHVAASLRVEHLAERKRIVEAEIAAGWQPLFMRGGEPGLKVAQAALTPALSQRERENCALTPAQVPPLTTRHPPPCGQCPPRDLGDSLERERDPLMFLRTLRSSIGRNQRLVGSVGNVRREEMIRGLIEGRWQNGRPEGLRYFSRRELEKLFYRAGFTATVNPARHQDSQPRTLPAEKGSGPLFSKDETEELSVERFVFEATVDQTADYGLTSIVIVTHNQLGCTRACLDSIRFVTDEPHELIVVDNGSTDGTVEHLRNCPDVKLIANADNRGFPAAVNQGIAASNGKQVLLLNNDVLVTTGWLRRMLDALEAEVPEDVSQNLFDGNAESTAERPHPSPVPEEACRPHPHPLSKREGPSRVGLVGPLANCASGYQEIDLGYRDLACLDGFAWEHAKANVRQVQEVERLIGFCLLIRREVIDQVGLLDERFGIGNYEDDDYCRRARARGWRLVVARDTFIHHFGHKTFDGAGIDLNAILEKNKRLYDEKWGDRQSRLSLHERTSVHGANGDNDARPVIAQSDLGLKTEDPRRKTQDLVLSLCMIVRNNAGTIRACLESIRPWVDEMVVVDTGSTDATPDICRDLGAQVHYFPWPDSFAIARNESLKYAGGQWIFWMDSDDVIDAENGRKLRQLVNSLPLPLEDGPPGPSRNQPDGLGRPSSSNVLGYVMQVHCPGNGPDGMHDVTVVDHLKLFRNRPDLRFEGRIHEQVLDAVNRANGDVVFTDIFVVHAGADHSPEGRKRKLKRDIKLLRLDLHERPNHTFVHFNLGMTYADAGKHRKAIKSLLRSLELAQPHESHVRKVYALLVASYREQSQKAEGRQACAEGLKLYPKDPELLFRNAMLLHEDGRHRAAELSYLAALANSDALHFASIDRGMVGFKARHNLAAVYTDMGALHKAEAEWRKITEEVPTYRDGWRGLVESLLLQGKVDDAARTTDCLRATYPRLQGLALALAARTEESKGQMDAALATLRRARRECPDDMAALDDLCRLLFYRGEREELEDRLRELVQCQPDNAAAHHNLGTLLMRTGRPKEAADMFRASLRERPDSPVTQLSLGYALTNMGRRADASTAFERCLRLAPNSPLAAEAQRQLAVVAA